MCVAVADNERCQLVKSGHVTDDRTGMRPSRKGIALRSYESGDFGARFAVRARPVVLCGDLPELTHCCCTQIGKYEGTVLTCEGRDWALVTTVRCD